MNRLDRACRGPILEDRRRAIGIAVLAALAAAGVARGQTVPYTAPQRFSVGGGLGQQELQRGTVFLPRVEGAIQYADNINLAQDGDDQINTAGIEVAPGFYASYSSDAFTGAIDYTLIGRVWEDSDFNDVSHRLAANGEWFAVPEWFAVRGQASYFDTVIDPGQSLNYGGLGIFGSSNLAEVAAASINPILSHTFNDFVFTAQYGYGRTWFLDEGKGQPTVGFVFDQDSEDQFANLSIGTAQDGRRLSGQVYYDWQRSEYEQSLPYEYERAGVSLSLLLGRSLSLVGDFGVESDLTESSDQGGLDSEFWSAGFRWTPDERTLVEARTGDRFFGQSYSVIINRRARLLEFSASYSEEPTVETRQLSLGDFNPGDLPPGVPDIDFGRFNSLPFVAKNGRASVAMEGSRTRLALEGFHYERDYLRGLSQDETGQGARFSASRQLASNLSADFDLYYREYERTLPEIGPTEPEARITTRDYDTNAIFRLNRETSVRLTVSAEAGYLNRGGDSDYDGWWVGLRGRWSPYASVEKP